MIGFNLIFIRFVFDVYFIKYLKSSHTRLHQHTLMLLMIGLKIGSLHSRLNTYNTWHLQKNFFNIRTHSYQRIQVALICR